MGEFRRSTRSASGFRSEQVTLPRSFCLSHITFFCLRVFEHTIGEDAANRQTPTPRNYLRPDDMILRTTTRTYEIDNPMWTTTPGIQSGNPPPHFSNSSMIVVGITEKEMTWGSLRFVLIFVLLLFQGALVKRWDGLQKKDLQWLGNREKGWDAYRLVPRLHCHYQCFPGHRPRLSLLFVFIFTPERCFSNTLLFYVCTHTTKLDDGGDRCSGQLRSGLAPGGDRRYPSVLDCLYAHYGSEREELHQLAR